MSAASSAVDGIAFYSKGSLYSSANLDEIPRADVPRHMLVVGMGRGGTTACAQVLEKLGFVCDTGSNAVLESKRLRALKLRRNQEEFLAEVASWDSGPDRWFWKEPKIHSLDFRKIVLAAPPSVGFLIVFRDIMNIALRNHDALGMEFFSSLNQAARNNLMLVEFVEALKDRSMAIVSYEKLITKADRTVGALAQYLGVADEARIAGAARSIAPESPAYQQAVMRQKAERTTAADQDSSILQDG